MSSATIPSVAAMNATFNNRMMAYASKFSGCETLSRESSTTAPKEPDNRAPKRKRDCDTSDEEETTEEEGQEETPEANEPAPKIILKINFINNIILSVNQAKSHQNAPPKEPATKSKRASPARRPSTPHPKIQRRSRPSGDQNKTNHTLPSRRSLRTRHATTTTTNTPKLTQSNPRTRHTPSSPPPSPLRLSHLVIENEKKERWNPIPLPSSFLPGDTEGPKAAWARLFPQEKPFGEYGGKPTGWMEKMCWKEGEWRARGPEEPYVERFLGRKGSEIGTVAETMFVEVGVRRGL